MCCLGVRTAACYLLVMLTCALLMTSSHSVGIELWLGLNSMWGVPATVENPANNTAGSGNTFAPTSPYPHLQSLGGVTVCVQDSAFTAANFTARKSIYPF